MEHNYNKPEELIPWLVLKSVPGIGNHLFKRLIDRFKSPQQVFDAAQRDILSIKGISQRIADLISVYKISHWVEKEIDLITKSKCCIITLTDKNYPPLLREIPDPPPFLYVRGNLTPLISTIAVVGSRNATRYGLSATRQLCSELAARKIAIVSGMALGIDSAAHRGAIAGNGKTIAVLGSGLNRIYPAENRKLSQQIARNGAVISEFSLNTEPDGHNFPIRNRTISGISLGTVVVEATKRSGSLITAKLAAEQNREVFAVPGSINSFKSSGTHTLIKQGAKLVENAQDIIEELTHLINIDVGEEKIGKNKSVRQEERTNLSLEELPVYQTLGEYPIHIDELVRELNIEPGKLSGILLQLELKGIIIQTPGKLFSRKR